MNDMYKTVVTENPDGSKTLTLHYRTLWIKLQERTKWNLFYIRRFINHPWFGITTLNLRLALWLHGGSVAYKVKVERGILNLHCDPAYAHDIYIDNTDVVEPDHCSLVQTEK